MRAIYKREMRSYFTGTIGYVFLVLFLAVAGLAFCYTTLFSMSAEVGSFYIIMMIFSAIALPLLTMKSFSEERKSKIEQLLLTAPVSLGSMVLGKFLAAYTMFAGATIFSSLYFLILYRYAFIQVGILLGNIVALLLVGFVFIAIGLFVSALTENQLAAAVGTIGIIMAFLLVGLINTFLPASYWLRYVFDSVSIFTRFQTFANGYFDLSTVIYYISMGGIFLYLTYRVYDRRRFG
ncbi:MAG: ABC transporter permease [Clostridia bacterium]|jgi:ABC-2 type transport system permease protein|nr:ABC transporter permease [Clostridia bacterium]